MKTRLALLVAFAGIALTASGGAVRADAPPGDDPPPPPIAGDRRRSVAVVAAVRARDRTDRRRPRDRRPSSGRLRSRRTYDVHDLMRPVTPSDYVWPPALARVEDEPETFGRTSSSRITVTP